MFPFQNGDAAPEVALTSATGQEWRLADHLGKMVCLYFGRGEYCPTTRGELAYFNAYVHIFKKLNCELAFVVNGGRQEHARIAQELRLRMPILVDDTGEIGNLFGIYGVNHDDMKRPDYRNYIAPGCYLIDVEGKIAGFWLASVPRGLPTPECILGILGYAEHNGGKY